MRRLRGRMAATLGASLLLAVPPVAGQQEPAPASGGWIGVGLRQVPRCEEIDSPRRAEAEEADADEPAVVRVLDPERCRYVPMAETVVVGSPADRAGVEPGDTLITIDGRRVDPEPGEAPRISLREGEPVEMTVARRDGRVTLEVTPGPRPAPDTPVRVRVQRGDHAEGLLVVGRGRGGSAAASAGAGEPADRRSGGVFRIELDRGETGEEVEMPARLVVGEDGRVYLLRAEEGGRFRVRMPAVDSLAAKLREINDSALAVARSRMRAALQRSREVERARGARAVATKRAAPRPALARMAGAEFRTLSAELAEYFEGTDGGVLVLRVIPGTPAHELGLRSGDVVVEAGGLEVTDTADLAEALSRGPDRDEDGARIAWVRKGNRMSGTLRRR